MSTSESARGLSRRQLFSTTGKAGLNCIHSTTGGLYEEHITNEICY